METPLSPWSDEDSKKVIEFLNMVADKAELKLSTRELIHYFKLLNWMQTGLLKKIEDSSVSDVKVYTKEEMQAKPRKGD